MSILSEISFNPNTTSLIWPFIMMLFSASLEMSNS
nr:MAG TPA: hypothetical protein [Caudoviricetes sp.]